MYFPLGIDNMLFKAKAVISLAAVTAVALTSYLPVQAAPPPIDLTLGGEGASAWNFTNIKPGDSGIKTVTLRNVGTSDGLITIWLSNLVNLRVGSVDPKYASLPGELSDYLKLNAASRGLEANVALPAAVKNFPQTSSGPYYVRVNPLRAGETLNLTWRWELPSQTGNNVQGKGTSFTLNYMLAELPPPGEPPVEEEPATPAPAMPQNPPAIPAPTPPPAAPVPEVPPATPPPAAIPPVTPVPIPPVVTPAPPVPPVTPTPEVPPVTPTAVPDRTLEVLMANSQFAIKTDANGIVQEAARVYDNAGNFMIDLAKGTRVTDPDGKALDRFELAVVTEGMRDLIEIPAGIVTVGPVYTIMGYREGKPVSHVKFEPYVTLALGYEVKQLPDNALPPFVVNFEKGGSLVKLVSPPGSIFESGKAKAIAYHASYFALLAEVVSPPEPLPPHFRVSNLNVNPGQARPGQTVTIRVDIANDGATGGIYEMHLIIDGVVRAVKEVGLEPNTVSTITFEVADLAPGQHRVSVAGLTGEFRVINTEASVPGTPIDWSLVDMSVIGLLAAGLLSTFLVIRRLRRYDNSSK